MRLRWAAAAALLVSLALAGCVQLSPEGEPTAGSSTFTGLDVVQAMPENMEPIPWQLIRADDSEVVLMTSKEHCIAPAAIVLQETDAEVSIDVAGRHLKEPCSSDDYSLEQAVKLQSPIGNRSVVGASTSE